jgi:thioredoxin reductase (NADPH)
MNCSFTIQNLLVQPNPSINCFLPSRRSLIITDKNQHWDVLIIGAGPAGLSAAIYSSWLGLKTVVLDSSVVGGRAILAPKIENFPGIVNGIKGNELIERMKRQAMRFNAEIRIDEEVIGLDLNNYDKKAFSRRQSYNSSSLIVATGTQRRKIRVVGETDFIGRGLSYCAVCDGPLFRESSVAIIGNSEEAAIDALFLADIAKEIIIVTHEKELNIEGTLLDRLRSKPNIEIIKGQVREIVGEQVVKAIKIVEHESQQEVAKEVKGVFVSLGGLPMTAVVKNAGINTDRNGCIMVDRQQTTNLEGVFAAGDCTCGGMQIVTAAGEGAMAAMRATVYTKRKLE